MTFAQKKAIQGYRARLNAQGLVRFEVLGRNEDRDLIRSLARRLADDGPGITSLRTNLNQTISGEPPKKGGILAALRRSPLVGSELNFGREQGDARIVDL